MEFRRLLENWNKFASSPQIIEEGVADLGLPTEIVAEINRLLINCSEKTKTWFGNFIKQNIDGGDLSVSRERSFESLDDFLGVILASAGEDKEKRQKVLEIRTEVRVMMAKFRGNTLDYDQRRQVVKFAASIFKKVLPKIGLTGFDERKVGEVLAEVNEAFITGPLKATMSQLSTAVVGLNAEEDATMAALQKETAEFDPTFASSSRIWRINVAARKVVDSIEKENQIVHKFDDGFYWYDLATSHCSIEAERLSNCGADSRGNLYSLRWKGPKDKISKSFVLVSYNDNEKKIYQIKGFEMEGEQKMGNRAPPKIIKGPKGQEVNLWDKVAWFIDEMGVDYVVETGEYVTGQENIEKFQVMNAYLAEKTSASFEDPNNRYDEMVEECRQIQSNWERRLDYLETSFEVDDSGDGYYVYYGASGGLPLEIPDLDIDIRNKRFMDDVMEAISDFVENRISRYFKVEQRYNQDFYLFGNFIRVPVSIYDEDSQADPEGYSNFCDSVHDIERFLDEIQEAVIEKLEMEGWIQTTSGDFSDFVQDQLEELDEELEHIHVEWDEDSPKDGVKLNLVKAKGGIGGTLYSFGDYSAIKGPYGTRQSWTSGLTPDTPYEKIYYEASSEFIEKAVSFIEKELVSHQAQAARQLEIPVGKEPMEGHNEANVEEVRVAFSGSSKNLLINIYVVIESLTSEDQIRSAVAMARFLNENADKIIRLLKAEFDRIIKEIATKAGHGETEDISSLTEAKFIDRIAREVMRRMNW